MSDLCILCKKIVTRQQHALSCDLCAHWQHRLCDTGVTVHNSEMLSVTGPAGFYKTPVNKFLLVSSVSTSLALIFPLQHYRNLFVYNYDLLIERGEYWRLLTSKLVFLDIKDLCLCTMLIYNFRFLERRFGSRKYASYLLAVLFLSAFLEVGVLACAKKIDFTFSLLPTGPFCVVFPQFVQFFLFIPRVASVSFLGVPVTGKTFTYILGLQLASTSPEYRLVSLCSLLAGWLWQWNFLKVQSVIKIPECVSSAVDRLVGWVLHAQAPTSSNAPMGATLELQRQERLDRLEEQMVQAAVSHNRNGVRPQPLNIVNGRGIFGNLLRREAGDLQHNTHSQPVSEDQVHRLTEMGFSDESVRRALQLTNNDISQATSILLHEAS